MHDTLTEKSKYQETKEFTYVRTFVVELVLCLQCLGGGKGVRRKIIQGKVLGSGSFMTRQETEILKRKGTYNVVKLVCVYTGNPNPKKVNPIS